MGTVKPVRGATPVRLKFNATASEDLVKKLIDEEGVKPSSEWEVSFDLKDIPTAELRKRLREAHERYREVEPYPVLGRMSEDPEEFLADLEPWLTAAEAEEVAVGVAAAEAEAEEAERSDRFYEGLGMWAASHGSKRLRLAVEGGYRANATYALERSSLEMPGFWVDTAGDCEWGDRVDPSEAALLLEKEVQERLRGLDLDLTAQIVWLTKTPRALDRQIDGEGLDWEDQEAIIVPDYLGRYLLVLPIAKDLRRHPAGGD